MAEANVNVLVVEDEKEIRELMTLHLLRQGYQVTECGTAEEAMIVIKNKNFPLYILDWMLPGMSGIDFLQHLRQNHKSTASVLMVTAKTEPQDIIHGLEKGADDYITKPFDSAIFLARVKALVRRSQIGNTEVISNHNFELNELKINFDAYEVFLHNQKLHLTPSEYKLLVTMVQNRGKVMTRDRLIEEIQGEGVNVVGRTVDTHVFGLRKKLESWGDNIETIRGIGYRVKI